MFNIKHRLLYKNNKNLLSKKSYYVKYLITVA